MRSKLFLIVVLAVLLVSCSAELTYTEQLELIVENIQSKLVEERVIHPNQLNLEDVFPGNIVIIVYRDGTLSKHLILTEPYWENGFCGFYTVMWENGVPKNDYIFQNSCADAGLIEYSVRGLSGWNPTNHITESEDSPLTPEQLEGVISNLIQKPSNEFLQLQQRDA